MRFYGVIEVEVVYKRVLDGVRNRLSTIVVHKVVVQVYRHLRGWSG